MEWKQNILLRNMESCMPFVVSWQSTTLTVFVRSCSWTNDTLDKSTLQCWRNKIKIGDDYTISQFADDTTIAIKNTKDNIKKTFEEIETFDKVSGLKLNIEKTEIILLGKTTEYNIPVKYKKGGKKPRTDFGNRQNQGQKDDDIQDYDDIQDKMKAVMNKWKDRRTSLAGKISIVKCLITSKLVYAMTNLPSPNSDYWKDVNHKLFKFIHNR